jgi:hypothetical protein
VRVIIPPGVPLGPHVLTLMGRSNADTRSVQYPLFVYVHQDLLPVVQHIFPSTPTAWPTSTPRPILTSTPRSPNR